MNLDEIAWLEEQRNLREDWERAVGNQGLGSCQDLQDAEEMFWDAAVAWWQAYHATDDIEERYQIVLRRPRAGSFLK